jgi:hypothetical protein
MTVPVDELRLDGNAAAGLLGEIFALEITSAAVTCDGCGRVSAIGTLMLYAKAMGAVLRCPACEDVMIVATSPRGQWCLDMRGVRIMRMAASPLHPARGLCP